MPGVQEVAALIETLEEDFNSASWSTRALFPHSHKERGVRINLGHFEKAPSPLRQEVFPDDVPEPPNVVDSDNLDYVYDWDYVASTDPIHPVDTNYAHPLDDIDPSWMLNHLSLEDFEASGGEVGFDANEAELLWTDGVNTSNQAATTWNDDIEHWDQNEPNTEKTDPVNDNAACDYKAGLSPPTPTSGLHSQKNDNLSQQERIQMVVNEFWKIVNDTDSDDQDSLQPPSHPADDLTTQMRRAHISEPPNTPAKFCSGLLTPPATPPRLLPGSALNEHVESLDSIAQKDRQDNQTHDN